MSSLERKASLVRKYICTVRPKMEPGTFVSEEPMNRKARGDSRPPVSENVLTLMELNARAASVLDPLIEELRKTETKIRGHRCDEMLREMEARPGAERSWPEARRDALWGMCVLLAAAAKRDFEVYVSASGVEGVGEGQPETKRDARKHDTRDSYRLIAARIEGLEAEGFSREEAKAKVQYEQDCGRTRVQDALSFVKAEREDPEKANADWRERERKRGRGAA